ncbi:hypothetical protein KAT63_05320 [Candidatus Parcubacteria bacterium]|nr:hypothetical protein [Candidatus Parcubacteria bacterium]
MGNEDKIEIQEIKFKGQGKYLLKHHWTVIKKKGPDDKVTIVSFDDKTTPATEQEKSVRIELIDTDNSFLTGKPREKEIIFIRKPGKTDIFVSDQRLANKITVELNQIKGKWTPSLWCTDPKLATVSALKTISKNKITGKIVPLIEKIMEDFYGDEN